MLRNIIVILLAVSSLFAAHLSVLNGVVRAHTEVFGDSTIDPQTRGVVSHLRMDGDVETMKGRVEVSMADLKSDNAKRDEHMMQTIEANRFPHATYRFEKVTKKRGDHYVVEGVLTFHGVQRPLRIDAQIQNGAHTLAFLGHSVFKMSDYGVKPPKLFFLTVRDRIDLTIDVTLKKE
ncbi:YceI family protein [Hydrogenimonas urashimensis]|uniref:YceI family protein n=1 Tax=Hydrogenimonas urashimensis TaxID=2740515 RepID=UPI001914F9C9|nr:YceI family protein [Hydrogenimonas urashimensis]